MNVSIIMPVYNAERYLEAAIQSVLGQTFQNFQLLMVDDGSCDGSWAICQKWAEKDDRIQVFHQENLGPSAARNTGLTHVTGDYLMFIDADDTLEPEAMAVLIQRMEESKADVCIYGWNIVEGEKRTPYIFSQQDLSSSIEQVYQRSFLDGKRCGGGYPWNKIWRVASIRTGGHLPEFDCEICIYEDQLWAISNYDRISSLVFENEPLYNYFIRQGSLGKSEDQMKNYQRRFDGARQVCSYVKINRSSALKSAQRWCRNWMSRYLCAKGRAGIPVTREERAYAANFSILPYPKDHIGSWLRFLYVRFVLCGPLE